MESYPISSLLKTLLFTGLGRLGSLKKLFFSTGCFTRKLGSGSYIRVCMGMQIPHNTLSYCRQSRLYPWRSLAERAAVNDCSYPGHCCDLDENLTFCEGLYCAIHPKAFAKVDDYLYESPGTVNHNNGRLLPLSFHEFLLQQTYTLTNVGPLLDIFVYILCNEDVETLSPFLKRQ